MPRISWEPVLERAAEVVKSYSTLAVPRAEPCAVKSWPDVSLVVLSRDPEKAVADQQATASQEAVWVAGARKYAHLSSKGSRTMVPNATHYVYIDAPDVTTTAINRVLSEAR